MMLLLLVALKLASPGVISHETTHGTCSLGRRREKKTERIRNPDEYSRKQPARRRRQCPLKRWGLTKNSKQFEQAVSCNATALAATKLARPA